MRDSSEIWCEASDISIDEINHRANLCYERYRIPTVVFISRDLYASLAHRSFGYTVNPSFSNITSGCNIIKIHTYTGPIQVRIIPKYKNFLLVGGENDFMLQEQCGIDRMFLNAEEVAKLDQVFEKLILNKDEA